MKRVILAAAIVAVLELPCWAEVRSIEIEGVIDFVDADPRRAWCIDDPTRQIIEPGDLVKMRASIIMAGGESRGLGAIEIVGKKSWYRTDAIYSPPELVEFEQLGLFMQPGDYRNYDFEAATAIAGMIKIYLPWDRRPWIEQDPNLLSCFGTGQIGPVRYVTTGDSNRDGLFNTSDLVAVFQQGEYEDGVKENSSWDSGDWDADGEFSSADFVIAFTAGTYEQPAAVVVPEPAGLLLLLLGFCYPIRRLCR